MNLSENDLSFVESESLTRALMKLEDVDLSESNLGTSQINSLLTTISRKNTKLLKLCLHGNDLSSVAPEALIILDKISYYS